jgi:hypothetical protein
MFYKIAVSLKLAFAGANVAQCSVGSTKKENFSLWYKAYPSRRSMVGSALLFPARMDLIK